LLESSVEKPGGLTGDIEYIPFDRTFPERSFGKVIEMISALTPKSGATLAVASDLPADAKAPQDTSDQVLDWVTPRPDWTRSKYEIAFMHMVTLENAEGVASIERAYSESQEGSRSENLDNWQAFAEHVRILFGKDGNLSRLRILAEAHPHSALTWVYLARAYEEFQDFVRAASAYQCAANESVEDTDRITRIGRAAIAYVRAGMQPAAAKLIDEMKGLVEQKHVGEIQMLRALRDVAETEKKEYSYLGFMERMVDLDPSDTRARITLAYKYSELEQSSLALFHYLKIPYQMRNSMTWNNLGVAYDSLKLRGESIDAFHRSEQMGETLAMANLAQKLTLAGFLKEAKELCDRAVTISDYHKNVTYALTRIREIPDEEDAKEAEFLEKAKLKSDFYVKFGKAAASSSRPVLMSRWQGPDCMLKVSATHAGFRAEGQYTQQGGTLANALLAISGTASSLTRFNVTYVGSIIGSAIDAEVTRFQDPPMTTLLSATDKPVRVLLVINESGSEIATMEDLEASSAKFYSLMRSEEGSGSE
jgi:tetratricopeptide (TPR) repeat protein